MLKVLHIVPGIPFGGMQKIAAELAAEQKARGLDARFLMVYDSPPLASLLKRLEVPVLTVGGTRPSFRTAREFKKLLRETSPDLVHLHGGLLWTNLLGLMAKRCPWIYHAHNYPVRQTGWRGKFLKIVNARLIDAVIGVSRSVSGEYERELKRQCPVFTVHNGIRLPANADNNRQHRRNDSPRFGMATRIVPDKGVFEFIEVAAAIVRRLPSAEFILAGDGPLLPEAKKRARQLGLEKKFDFPGFVNDMDQFWNSLDVALFTSPKEPFGLRLIEPMLYQVPVAAYLTGAGSDEIIEEGRNAVTAPWEKPDRLAEQAVRLVTDSTLRETLIIQANRDVTTKFSTERMAAQVEAVYSKLMGLKK
jgi:glycosyltransferase involved in cell wall biosynthesis